MTKELFDKANEILTEIKKRENDLLPLEERAKRFDDYIEWMDGRHQPIEFAGKTYKKVEIKFNMDNKPMTIHTVDMFDLVEENKKDFIAFLKKCQSNYQKKITENNRQIKELQKQFDELSEESAEVKSA